MAKDAIDFWFSVGSTYTYLTASRLEKTAAAENVRFNWRVFSVRTIMREQKNLNANVDFYSATVYYSLDIPTDLFTPIFPHDLRNLPSAENLLMRDVAPRFNPSLICCCVVIPCASWPSDT